MLQNTNPIPFLENQIMVAAIMQLPDSDFKPKKRDQMLMLISNKNFWGLIGKRIDFLQLKQFGHLPEDPLDNHRLDDFSRKKVDVHSRHYFSILQLVIEGFRNIQKAAIAKERHFPFETPRQLFAQICRDIANGGISALSSEGLNQGVGLKEFRKQARRCNAFYKDSASTENEKEAILLQLQKGNWFEFWIFAIWEHRYEREFVNSWKDFVRTHTDIGKFLDKNDYPGKNVSMVKWNDGNAVRSESCRPIKSWGILDNGTTLNIS